MLKRILSTLAGATIFMVTVAASGQHPLLTTQINLDTKTKGSLPGTMLVSYQESGLQPHEYLDYNFSFNAEYDYNCGSINLPVNTDIYTFASYKGTLKSNQYFNPPSDPCVNAVLQKVTITNFVLTDETSGQVSAAPGPIISIY